MKHNNPRSTTKQFALQAIKFCERLPKGDTTRTLQRQLLQSETSVGANYRAACRARSKRDFIAKMGIVLEESDESAFWIELLIDSAKAKAPDAGPLLREVNELVAICISSINAARAGK